MLVRTVKKTLSLLLSLLMILSSFFVCDFSAMAKTSIETVTAKFDFANSFNDGAPPITNTVGSGNVSFIQYRNSGYESYSGSSVYHDRNSGTYSKFYSEPISGCFEEDGIVFIDDLSNYIQDNRDFEISWRYCHYNKGFDDNNSGYFSLGTAFNPANKGASGYNLSENDVLSVNYSGQIRQANNVLNDAFPRPLAGIKNCSIYYSAENQTFKITIDDVTRTVSTSYRPSQINYFGIGSSTRTSYGKFIIKNITIKVIEQRLSDDECKQLVGDAMAAYEAKISTGTVYKNMSAAYRAYVNCQKAYDAYVYGGATSVNLKSYVTELNNAVANLTPWTAPKGNAVPLFSTDDTSNSDNAANCLWAETSNDPLAYSATNQNVDSNFYYHTSVYMYDGDVRIPFMVGMYRHSWWWSPRYPRVWYAQLTGSSGGLSVRNSSYRGGEGNRNFKDILNMGYYISSSQTLGNSIILSTDPIRYMANYFTVSDSSFGNSDYYIKAYPTSFKMGYGDRDTASQHEQYDVTLGGNKVFYIINYKSLADKMDSNKSYLRNISKYKEGGLEKLMAAYDVATAVNPTSYDYSTNTEIQVSSCANVIRNAVNQFNNVGAINQDSTYYAALRTKLGEAKSFGDTNPIITNGQTQTTRYTSNSWNAYTSAVSTAKAAMANVITSSGYSSSYASVSINNIANGITNAVSNLKYNYIVDYVNYAGESMGCIVGAENTEIQTDLVKNTDITPGTQEHHSHSIYSWPKKVLSRAEYANTEVVTINETVTEEECNLQEVRTVSDGDCTSPSVKVFACTVCGGEYEITGESLGHTYESTVVAPTCTERGYTHYVCTRCGDSYDDNYTDMIEHSYVSTVIAPTCTEKGYTANKCVNCGYEVVYEDSYVDALGHQYTHETVSEPNCIFAGAEEYTCHVCGDTYITELPIDSNVHAELVYSRTVAPTATERGYDIYYCSNLCGYWEKKNITSPIGGDSNLADYIESYNAAVASVVTDFAAYTQSSVDEYQQIISQAQSDGEAAISNASIPDIELATKTLIEASAVLRIKTLDVKIYINCSDGEIREIVYSAEGIDYGETLSLDVSDELTQSKVEKWTVEQNGVTKKVAMSSSIYDMVVTDDAIVNVYLTDEEPDSTGYSKVTLLNHDNKVIGTSYVRDGYVIDLADETQFGVTAPKVPFYQFAGWRVVDGDMTVHGDTVIQATYIVI